VATFLELYKSLDADPQKRGKQFEHFTKWFLKNDPEWSTQVAQVWLWEEYPERWGVDCGIDLVFRHKNGENWAVQAKCYSPTYDITKHDVDKFLSESNRKGIDKRLLIASTDRIGKNAIQVCEAQDKQVVRLLLSDLDRAELEYPACYKDLHKAKRKAVPTPRPHQLEAIGAVADSLQDAERGQLIMACGTGKTFTTLWIKERLESKRTLVLLPSLSLLSQTLREWTSAASQPFDILCVCSDETVGKRGEDEIIHSVAELAFPVTSDIVDIQRFLNGEGDKVIFSTYHSSPLVADAQADQLIAPFDLVIADEAHRCTGKVSSAFATVLDNDRIIASKRLFATATPRTYTTSVKKQAEDRGVEVVGMDDEAVFGKVLYSLPFGEAIRKELLTDYRIVIIGVDSPMIAEWIKNRELIKTDTGIENDAGSMAAQIGLIKAIKDYDLKRIISFHNRVSRAESFKNDMHQVLDWISEEHRPNGELWTDFVSGAMPTDKRRQKLDYLKGLNQNQRGLLTNARCLSEGVDVPSLDAVAFIDPKSSQVDIVQAVGRAIRLSQDKKFGTIIIPVFIEHGDDAISSIEASNFKPVWEVLNAFKSHDEELSQELDKLRTELGKKFSKGIDSNSLQKISIDLPKTVDADFSNKLRTYLVEQVTESWNFWFGLLETFIEQEGHCSPPALYKTFDGYRLGSWINYQRTNKNKILPERKARLETLQDWVWDAVAELWEEGFRYLKEFAQREGHSLVSSSYKSPDGYRLGQWLSTQRTKKSIMSPERRVRLEELTGWNWIGRLDSWDEGFQYLKDFIEQNGHLKVPQNFTTTSGYRLGLWVTNQRVRREGLSLERKAQMESLNGWSWEPFLEMWEEGYRYLKEFAEHEGHTKVSQDYKTVDGFKLGTWVGQQRTSKEMISSERKVRLEAMPGWIWDTVSGLWDEGFGHLKAFLDKEGHCLVPARYKNVEGYPIGNWVGTQRAKRDSLAPDRIERLEALTNWSWDPFKDKWEKGYNYLKEFADQEGNCLFPALYKNSDDYRLGSWANTQRVNKSKNLLSQDRIDRLEALSGWVWSVY
jgi:superfamily II DNA or RNA helicase